MFITFPANEKIKARLDSVCQSLGITYEEWFEKALVDSEFDVMSKFLGNPEDQANWKWDTNLCRFVRRSDAE